MSDVEAVHDSSGTGFSDRHYGLATPRPASPSSLGNVWDAIIFYDPVYQYRPTTGIGTFIGPNRTERARA